MDKIGDLGAGGETNNFLLMPCNWIVDTGKISQFLKCGRCGL